MIKDGVDISLSIATVGIYLSDLPTMFTSLAEPKLSIFLAEKLIGADICRISDSLKMENRSLVGGAGFTMTGLNLAGLRTMFPSAAFLLYS